MNRHQRKKHVQFLVSKAQVGKNGMIATHSLEAMQAWISNVERELAKANLEYTHPTDINPYTGQECVTMNKFHLKNGAVIHVVDANQQDTIWGNVQTQ